MINGSVVLLPNLWPEAEEVGVPQGTMVVLRIGAVVECTVVREA